MIVLDLPAPPSVNRIWRTRHDERRFYKDKKYTGWIKEAGSLWLAQRAKSKIKGVAGRFRVSVLVNEKFYEKRDLDNFSKTIPDLLKSLGITADDKYCRSFHLDWSDTISADIQVTVEAA